MNGARRLLGAVLAALLVIGGVGLTSSVAPTPGRDAPQWARSSTRA